MVASRQNPASSAPTEPLGLRRQGVEVDVVGKRLVPGVHLEDGPAGRQVG